MLSELVVHPANRSGRAGATRGLVKAATAGRQVGVAAGDQAGEVA